MSSLKNPSVLAFERKLCSSDGLMYAGSWQNRYNDDEWKPIKIQHKVVRGTISNRLKSNVASDSLKLNAEIQKPNIQEVDIAALSFDANTLKVVFTLRILGNISIPSACNDQDYRSTLFQSIEKYLEGQRCHELSLRYAENLANGRFLWRNRIAAENIDVRVSLLEGDDVKNTWTFDSSQFSLRRFSAKADDKMVQLAETIRVGLMGKSFIFLKVEGFARLGSGQEVFPSQELVRESRGDKHKKSKFLYAVNEIAAMHSQKIGNAIRTIDTWYGNTEDLLPIAVEPYGSVTTRGVAFRPSSKKIDFYTLLDGWIIKGKIPPLEQQHFVVACLARGGVFGEKGKD
ncbi:MAG: type I-F CRISPR-associated protein Csy3 [Waddliaceae bacterium]